MRSRNHNFFFRAIYEIYKGEDNDMNPRANPTINKYTASN